MRDAIALEKPPPGRSPHVVSSLHMETPYFSMEIDNDLGNDSRGETVPP